MSQEIDSDSVAERAAHYLSGGARPFLRWAGSKRRLLPGIVPHLPRSFNRYYEPFLGGGALFFLLQPANALLSDANSDLINVWQRVKGQPEEVYEFSTAHSLDSVSYYKVRDMTAGSDVERAGNFIYLNRGAFNGLYRVNRSGKFNVPWGAPRTTTIIEREALLLSAEALKPRGVKVATLDFEVAINRSRKGDLVYLDPPYVTGHNDNGFIDYNETLFSWKDQVRLAEAAERARERGAYVMVSNAHHIEVEKLYSNFRVETLTRQSNIAGDKTRRGKVSEALFIGVKDG